MPFQIINKPIDAEASISVQDWTTGPVTVSAPAGYEICREKNGNYEQWVNFFLLALVESAEDATVTVDKLVALHDKNAALISGMGRAAKNAMLVFDYLEANPIIEIRKTAEALGITFNTASSAVRRLTDAGILMQTTNASRNRTFAYEDYLSVLRKGT